ncbi:hypothetical protein [Arenimonas sp. MALMAid1274]|uniref:hypothetical protein n=1 Tax=Arenimonas sp. MALMAid1274 TaxID=3411630 RepID=UPI003BA142D8
MPRLSIDELVAIEDEEDLNEAFFWIDWRSMESEVVEAFAERLDAGDELGFREEDWRTIPIYNGVEYPVPLTQSGSDRYVMIFSLMEILKDRYTVLRDANCCGDTHGFLLLSHEEAADLTSRFPKWKRKHLDTMTPGVDGFSGLDVPWYGHEAHAPKFTQERARLDAESARVRERSHRFAQAVADDYAVGGEGEEGLLSVLSRQHAAAGAYAVGSVLCALAAAMGLGVAASATRTLWIAAGLFALAGVHHAVLAWHVRGGYRPKLWQRILPAVVIIGLMLVAPRLLRGG